VIKITDLATTNVSQPAQRPGGYPVRPDSSEADPIINLDDLLDRRDAIGAFWSRVHRYTYVMLRGVSVCCTLFIYRHLEKGSSNAVFRRDLEQKWPNLYVAHKYQISDVIEIWARLTPHWHELRRREAALEALREEYFEALAQLVRAQPPKNGLPV
jgi:hypothetical protein